jgi:hypothetical protein
MKNKSYQIGDLLYHPLKKQGSKYAIVVKTHKKLEGSKLRHGFAVKWFEKPEKNYWFSVDEWCETEKGFRLMAKGKR